METFVAFLDILLPSVGKGLSEGYMILKKKVISSL